MKFAQNNQFNILLALSACALVSIYYALSKGLPAYSLYQIFKNPPSDFTIIFYQLRLPRVLSGFICGAMLGLAGLLMQLLLANPLADPYLLGVSSGATLGSTLAIAFGVQASLGYAAAWGGSIGVSLLMLALAYIYKWRQQDLLLIGVAIAALLSAIMSCMFLTMNTREIRSMYFFLNGDLTATHLPIIEAIALTLSILICCKLRWPWQLLQRGESTAKTLGVAVERHYLIILLISSGLTALAVILGGCIGFIGMIVPQLAKRYYGENYLYLPWVVCLGGGSLVVLADSLGQTLLAPAQIPVGIMTVLLGVPVFFYLIKK